MAHSIVYPTYERKCALLEARKEKLQRKIEDLQSDADMLDHEIMKYNEKLDHLKNKMPLVSYPPLMHKLSDEYDIELQQKKTLYEQVLNIKSEIATIIYDIEEMDLEVSRLSELTGIANT